MTDRPLLMEDPRVLEYRAAAHDVSSGISANIGAQERYRHALVPYVECLAEHTPEHVRPHMMAALFQQNIPVSIIALGFRASEEEFAPIRNLPEVVPEPVDEAERLSRLPYRAYLKTAHWQEVRSAALRKAKNRCELCNCPDHLEVHHKHYKSKGQERPADVIVLCASCHSRHHGALRAA